MYQTLALCINGFHSVVERPNDLIFIDNGSQGTLTKWATTNWPDITVISLDDNILFCGGYNTGIKLAVERGYDYVLIVNADTEVVNLGFVCGLIDAMERYQNAAFIGPLVYFRELGLKQNTCLTFPRLYINLVNLLPLRLRRSPNGFSDQQEREVEFLNGVCVLCRCDAIREIGYMDETFGAYVEDTDWSWRARQKGWTSIYIPIPSIIHHEEPTGYEHYSFKTFLLKRNTVWWYRKNGMFLSAWGYAFGSVVFATVRLLFNNENRSQYAAFLIKLIRVYLRILFGEPLGPWFGPPLEK
jgi:hypothetical protein